MYFALALQNRPETCVTQGVEPDGSWTLVLRTMMRYALERELYRGSTSIRNVTTIGYRRIKRYKESGLEGLLNLSSKPHNCSHATPETIENAILALRGKYPPWGARKLKAKEQLNSSVECPRDQRLREHPSASRTHESKA